MTKSITVKVSDELKERLLKAHAVSNSGSLNNTYALMLCNGLTAETQLNLFEDEMTKARNVLHNVKKQKTEALDQNQELTEELKVTQHALKASNEAFDRAKAQVDEDTELMSKYKWRIQMLTAVNVALIVTVIVLSYVMAT